MMGSVSPVRMLVAILLSLALGVGGLYLVFGGAVFRAETYHLRNPDVSVVALVLVAFLAKWLSPAVRIGLLCGGQKIPVPFRSALLVHLVAMFVAAIAPQNTGFVPATVAALRRLGVPVGRGIGVSVQIALLDLVFFAWSVPLSLGYLDLSGTLELPAGAGVAAIATALLAILFAAVLSRRPRLVSGLILAVARWRLMARFASRLRGVARDYQESALDLMRMPARYWLALHLATAACWIGGFVLLWALMRLYGVEIGLLATLAILSSLTLLSHFVPTPGGSGFLEAAVGFGIGADPDGAAALLLWRLAGFYVIFLLGPLAGWLLYHAPPVAGGGKDEPGDIL